MILDWRPQEGESHGYTWERGTTAPAARLFTAYQVGGAWRLRTDSPDFEAEAAGFRGATVEEAQHKAEHILMARMLAPWQNR